MKKEYMKTSKYRTAVSSGLKNFYQTPTGRLVRKKLSILKKDLIKKGWKPKNMFKCGHKVSQNVRDSARERITRYNKNPDFIKKRLKGLIKKPNKPEKKLMKLMNAENFPYKYVGDGSVIIGFKNPDFVNVDGQKKIIELFGDYWHRSDIVRSWHSTEIGCTKYYSKFGFDTLVIWESELDNLNEVKEKIYKFNMSNQCHKI